MSGNAVLDHLNAEAAAFPSRVSGEEFYSYMGRLAARYLQSDRQELTSALTNWLLLRTEPKTMLAVQIAKDLRLNEVKPELESLLTDIHNGRAFLPYYSKVVEAVIMVL